MLRAIEKSGQGVSKKGVFLRDAIVSFLSFRENGRSQAYGTAYKRDSKYVQNDSCIRGTIVSRGAWEADMGEAYVGPDVATNTPMRSGTIKLQ